MHGVQQHELLVKAPGSLKVSGNVGALNAASLQQAILDHLAECASLRLDLSGIKEFNTMLLAVICGIVRFAKQHDKSVEFVSPPSGMRAIAKLSQVDQVLFAKPKQNKK